MLLGCIETRGSVLTPQSSDNLYLTDAARNASARPLTYQPVPAFPRKANEEHGGPDTWYAVWDTLVQEQDE